MDSLLKAKGLQACYKLEDMSSYTAADLGKAEAEFQRNVLPL